MGGIFGVVSEDSCVQTLFYGTDYHSHLGTEHGGMAVYGHRGFYNTIHEISQAQFKSRFVDDYRKMEGHSGIGAIDDESPQPLIFRSKFGVYAVVATGLITNKSELVGELLNEGASFTEVAGGGVNNSEIVASLINRGDNIVEGIASMRGIIEGSICVLVLTAEGIYAARDKVGRFPLALGRSKDPNRKSYVVATEASSFENLGYELQRFLGPGEIALLTPDGVRQLKPEGSQKKICSFLWIYTGSPSSIYDGVGVESTRERCGRYLARRDHVKVDFVAGVPDSGVGHAVGYAMESGIPYRRPLVKYTPGYGRSYTPPTQEIRDLVATMKLVAVRDVIFGSRMVICDDSIVRGTQLKNLTVKKLWDNGAKEIHIRPACPPLMYPCIYASSTRTTSELVCRKAIRAMEGRDLEDISAYLDTTSAKHAKMIDWIRQDLNVTSLRYMTIEDMIAAIGLPADQLCLHCWLGK
ncbi:MAG TPA: amidophosphoribosyltransferase [Smithellaceae bacterium]|nr:amidophosphoribosyltransferase [Syntrophaceae bacterium]HOU56987.1 amidophosphoribosyltransferase [Smithellaceae bacterium]MBP9532260.1 amidophosphoribosyltransferase [Syntrophaceae bacterium]HQG99629.1 amidophosphoribosyltransferase [Smithellaceae bacterium]HQH04788.1 amidophosphoribosyltransferase [Smithellaceae bacterium]